MGRDDHNLHIPSEAAFEIVARDSPVTADGKPDRSTGTMCDWPMGYNGFMSL